MKKMYIKYDEWSARHREQIHRDTERQYGKSYEVFINKPINTMTKPPGGSTQQQIDTINNQNAMAIVNSLQSLL